MTIYTIGHSNHAWGGFLALLRQHRILLVADVRSAPWSRFQQFCQPTLRASLREAGIRYEYRPKLGGRHPRHPDELRVEIENLLTAPERPVCLMCSEGDPFECHRHNLLTQVILDMEIDVMHIHTDGRLESGAEEDTKQIEMY